MKIYLTPLIQKYKIKVWDDPQISPSSNRKEETRKPLAAAKIAILLVSPDFLASDFIAKEESYMITITAIDQSHQNTRVNNHLMEHYCP